MPLVSLAAVPGRRPLPLPVILSLLWPLFLSSVLAQNAETKRVFNVPSQNAESALKLFSNQSHRSVIMNANTVQGIRTNPLKGEYTAAEALQRLLDGTGLVATPDPESGSFVIHRETTDPNG